MKISLFNICLLTDEEIALEGKRLPRTMFLFILCETLRPLNENFSHLLRAPPPTMSFDSSASGGGIMPSTPNTPANAKLLFSAASTNELKPTSPLESNNYSLSLLYHSEFFTSYVVVLMHTTAILYFRSMV